MAQFTTGTLTIVTGASQGIGRTIAIELGKHLVNDCTIILMARSEKGLNETKSQILQLNKNVNVHVYPIDLSKATTEDYQKALDLTLSTIDKSKIENAVIFHNAGQVGVLDETINLTDIQVWRDYYDLNLFSTVLLNAVFMEKIKPIVKELTVVNITSLCGTQPFKHMSMYGSGKAARNLFFKVLAEENKDVRVLNYSPGPVDTEMLSTVANNIKDADMKESFTGVSALTTEQTVGKLLSILEKSEYKSGDVIDYYDRI